MTALSSKVSWTASETNGIQPYPASPFSLTNVALKIKSCNTFSSDEYLYIEEGEGWDNIDPFIDVKVDALRISGDTKIPGTKITISVIARDRALNKFGELISWPLCELPTEPISLLSGLRDFSWSSRLDIVVTASLSSSVELKSTIDIMPKGVILAQKIFKLRERNPRLHLPIKLVEPEEFEKINLSKDTIWAVYWIGIDVAKAPEQLFQVWLNKEFEDKFIALNSSQINKAGISLSKMINAQILYEICAYVLRYVHDNPLEGADPQEGLVNIIQNWMADSFGDSIQITARNFSGNEGSSQLFSWCYQEAGANAAFSRLNF